MNLPFTARLARASASSPWWVIGAWIVALIAAVVIMGAIGTNTTTEIRFTNDPESQHGMEVLEDAGLDDNSPTDETVIILAEDATIDDASYRERVEAVTAELRAMDGIVEPESVTNYYELSANPETAPMAEGLVSADRRTTLIPATLTGTQDEATENATEYLDNL